ncbi:PaaI family thioesterase [Modestobacter lapidis]|nr:PaaI family thioesterase [Modestobacter lapidis]
MTTAAPTWLPADLTSPLDDKLGIEIVDWDPDRVVARMPVEGNTQPFGLLHGGATCALVESVGSHAAALAAGPGGTVVGIELNASYLRGTRSGVVTAVCTPVRRGRTLATFLVDVHDDHGHAAATARLTCMIRRAR